MANCQINYLMGEAAEREGTAGKCKGAHRSQVDRVTAHASKYEP